jgi:hypothetical protein
VARAKTEGGGFACVDGFAEGFGEALDFLGVGDARGAEDRETVKPVRGRDVFLFSSMRRIGSREMISISFDVEMAKTS